MTKKIRHMDYQDYLNKKLKDSEEFALAYLNEALADEDQRVFLLALKDVIEAQGHEISGIAQDAHLSRQNIYRILSNKGNPKWRSLTSLFGVLGYQVHLLPKDK